MQNLFLDHGLSKVKRLPAVDVRRVKKLRGYVDAESYAYALSLRLGLREAKRRRAASVVLFHDEMTSHPQFNALLCKLALPEDWGIFLLGAEHRQTPDPGGTGIGRCNLALGCHAVAVRAPYYSDVMRALGATPWRDGSAQNTTVAWRLAPLQRVVPTYAALPNLVWPRSSGSDPCGGRGYDEDGWQKAGRITVVGAVQQSLKVQPWRKREELAPILQGSGKAAFLFLTRGSLNQPRMWEDYFKACPERVSVHVHPKERKSKAPAWFRKAYLPKSIVTAWGDISLVKAQLALLKKAYDDPDNQVFVFASESCVPVKPLVEFLEGCERSGWRGMMKFENPEVVAEYDVSKAKRYTAAPQIPPWLWKLHSQWVTLNREMAHALLEEDLTDLFARTFAPDESYFGTVLALKGYPLETKCLPVDSTWVSWERQPARHPKELTAVTDVEALSLRLGGYFFARKFHVASDIAGWGLHLQGEI